ncbi:MAG: tRNA-dihydrouridine synthase [Neisseria sp.]|nr:tRNA-dihydrouridine synthase [Neisseria sp.]
MTPPYSSPADPCRIVLAPMQGLADPPMRELLTHIGGFDECVSEFVRITHTVHSRPVWLRAAPELAAGAKTAAGVPCTVQLLGGDEAHMAANALAAVRCGAKKIDLNFGCPSPTVNRHQGGAVLLREPERIYRIVRALRQALPPHIPLSGKMRLGYEDTSLALENARAITEGGACGLTVHARTKLQGYDPPAHWEWIGKIARSVPVPVTANGDIFTPRDYLAMVAASGCTRVMIGRGAVMRPDLARRIKHGANGGKDAEMGFEEIAGLMNPFIDLCLQYSDNEKYAVARLKQWLGMLKKAYPGAGLLFEEIRALREIAAIRPLLGRYGRTAEKP